ncbi:MAG: hypothetical protein PHR35_07580 [Kiritimatiellae bacterium]|nr:hypothetical protein [Kiritimatiellia bacterium]
MYAFFMKQAGMGGHAAEGRIEPAEARRLWATPRGSTARAGSRRVFEFTAERAAELARARGKPTAERVAADARRLLNVGSGLPALPYRALRSAGGGGEEGIRGQFAVETEPGIEAIVTTHGDPMDAMLPPRGAVTLYVGHVSADDDVRRLPAIGGWPGDQAS